MSPSHSHIVGAVTDANPPSPEDDDDICPVCESECTCQNRVNPAQSSRPSVTAPSALSISSLNGSFTNVSSAPTANSLKIKLTVPPTLKFRKQHPAGQVKFNGAQSNSLLSSSSVETFGLPATSLPAGVSAHHLALGVADPAAPKRRGRPPKAVVAAREAAKAALAASQNAGGNGDVDFSSTYDPNMNIASGGKAAVIARGSAGKGRQVPKYAGKGVPAAPGRGQKSKGKTTTGRKVSSTRLSKNGLKSLPQADFSDDALSERFPTFVSAASSSSHTSSSESSDSESELSSLDSELEEETQLLMHEDKNKTQARRIPGSDRSQKRHEYASSSWEVRSRKSSVELDEEEDADVDSDQSGDDADELDDDDDSDDDTADEDVDADTEGNGLDDVEIDNEETSSRIGVTFGDGAAAWSDDEGSSFDADLFFANLDGSSDSDSSPEMDSFDSFDSNSDLEFQYSLSGDEEDALLLMDIDSSLQVRRGQGEFEFGLELDSLSFGWDGQVLLTSSSSQNLFNLGFDLHQAGQDVDMQPDMREEVESDGSATADEMFLEESDGETTEDELVDSDGLPNPRAMMLFRWPSTVSAINPLSTVGYTPSSPPQAPPNATESMRIALASFSAHQGSPAPSPADILAGKISMEDLEDIEMEKTVASRQSASRKRAGGAPVMGDFMTILEGVRATAVIDGKGAPIPSPFPRSKVVTKRRKVSSETERDDSCSGAVEPPSESTMSSAQSSDETFAQSQLQTSELSSTDAIDLDDVLDSSFLDLESMSHDHEINSHEQFTMADGSSTGSHIQSLSRWERIPMATFRRTRETAIGANVEGSTSDTGLSVFGGMSSLMGDAMLTQSKPHDKKSNSARKRSKTKGANSLTIPDDLLSLRDGDRTPTSSGSHQGFKSSKKEVRREKAMMKRKMMGKPAQHRHQPQYRTHPHHPNHKSRGSSSMQRMSSYGGSNSSMPSFSL